jgi:hypothetical protein
MGFWDKVKEAAQNAGEQVSDKLQNDADSVTARGQESEQKAQNLMDSATTALLTGLAAGATQLAGGARDTMNRMGGAARDGRMAAGDLARKAQDDVRRQAEWAAGIVRDVSGRIFQGAKDCAAGAGWYIKTATGEVIHYRERKLNGAENSVAYKIFREFPGRFTGKAISSGLGRGRRCYTSCRPTTPDEQGLLIYVMFMGPQAYSHGCTAAVTDAWGNPMDAILAHELTHIWQFTHGRVPPDTIVKEPQAWFDGSVYKYKAGADWNTYNLEQQAQIVQDWYLQGCVEKNTDPLWRYIRDNMRGGG